MDQHEPISRKDLREPKPVTGAQRALGATLGRPRPKGRAGLILACLVLAAVIMIPLGVFKAVGRPAPSTATPVPVPERTIAATAPLASAMQVAGRLGSVPVVTFKGHLAPPSKLVTDTLIKGRGHTLAEGDGIVLSVATFNSDDGTNTTGTASGRRIFRGTLAADQVGADLDGVLAGVKEGSRLILRKAVSGADTPLHTEVTVVDVLPTRAQGTDVSAKADPAAPGVTLADDGTISVATADHPAPTSGSTSVLIQGKGEQVQAGDSVIARYAVFSWDGTQRSSSYSWTAVPGIINLDSAISGLSQRLVDVPVGSRVVVSLPADQARGDGAIVVVVDIVAVQSDADQLGDQANVPASAPPTAVKVTPSATPTS